MGGVRFHKIKTASKTHSKLFLLNIGTSNDLRPQTLNEPANLEFGSTLGVSFRREDWLLHAKKSSVISELFLINIGIGNDKSSRGATNL